MAERSLAVRAAWFLAVGWWVTPLLVNAAWLCNATVVGLSLAIALVNRVPTVVSLAEPRALDPPEPGRGGRSPVVRAAYFLLVGWWLSLVWANLAALLATSVVGLPLAFWMFNRLPYVTSLHRYHG